MQEKWKSIKGYEGLYEISTKGRVRSLDRTNHIGSKLKGKILSPSRTKEGYLGVNLFNCGKPTHFRVHRLVAEAFLQKSKTKFKIQVNHIDNNPGNNNVENLEWCTPTENMQHAARFGMKSPVKDYDTEKLERVLIYSYNWLSPKQISVLENIPEPLVRRIAKRQVLLPFEKLNFEIEPRPYSKGWLRNRNEKIKYLRSKGFTIFEIGYLFDISYTLVSLVCRGLR